MGMWLNLAPFEINLHHISLQVLFIITLFQLKGVSPDINNAVHITALLGESVVFNCGVDFPGDTPVPYVLQWEKKGQDIPVYIWYDSYPTHEAEEYKGRISRVSFDSPFGMASLNLTNIREADQGWYECKVVFLNRSPNSHKNGTWFHLDVHAPPRFSVTPEEVIYVNLGDAIILNCQAEGTPTPEIVWYKDENIVDVSATTGVFNDGTELRISNIRSQDIGDYTCIARNGEGQISHSARVIIAVYPYFPRWCYYHGSPHQPNQTGGGEGFLPVRSESNAGQCYSQVVQGRCTCQRGGLPGDAGNHKDRRNSSHKPCQF
uniref:Protein turtle n=1 Tax=Cacopsylla melanoneura TaxID=428564 RepID=A0A8D8UYH0_9HEMI